MSYSCVVQCSYMLPNSAYSWAQTHILPESWLTSLIFMIARKSGRKRPFRVELKKSSRLMYLCLPLLLPRHLRPVFPPTQLVRGSLRAEFLYGRLNVSSEFPFPIFELEKHILR